MLTTQQKLKVIGDIASWPGFAVWTRHFTDEEREYITELEERGVVQFFVKATGVAETMSELLRREIRSKQ